jgi:hypothetical protein
MAAKTNATKYSPQYPRIKSGLTWASIDMNEALLLGLTIQMVNTSCMVLAAHDGIG